MNPERRTFIQASAVLGAGLTLSFYLPFGISRVMAGEADKKVAWEPNAFLRIATDGEVTVIAKHLEMGQGIHTGLATLVAEELDADWTRVKVEGAPANASLYKNLAWGPAQGTGQSTSLANSFEQMRQAGAIARAMLVAAAAEAWGVPSAEIAVRDGVLSHPSGRKAGIGAFADAASYLSVPENVTLKDPATFRLIGKRISRKDNSAKLTGSAVYTADMKLPGMLTALVAHAPRFGAKVKSFDATQAKAIKGVVDVVQIPTGVAVLAEGFWPARKGRDALRIEWDESGAMQEGTAEILERFHVLADQPGQVVRQEGDTAGTLKTVAKKLQADYTLPYLAHAAMEPMDCVIARNGDGCELWHGEQMQTLTQLKMSAVMGVKLNNVKINMLLAGGSFGRRGNPVADYQTEAAHILKAIQGRVPVKLLWTREDDMRAGFYRPLNVHRLEAGLDASGKLVAWHQRIVGQSILADTPLQPVLVQNGIDPMSVEGARAIPYGIPNLQLELHTAKTQVPVLWWRSVGHTHTAFAIESFIDELAVAAGKDPVEFRRGMLADQPRLLKVMELAADRAGWGKPMPKNSGRGIAVHQSFNTYVAQVAEVRVEADNTIRVERVVCAVDCGMAVNPNIIEAQMQGGIGFGLSAALNGAISIDGGRVKQSNFHDYPVLRMDQMPLVEVHIVPSAEAPTGVGEPGVPPIAPAVCNAIYAATGKRIRSLPVLSSM